MNYNENKSRALMLQGKAVEKVIHFAMQYGDLVPFSTIHDYTAKYFDKHAKKLHKNIREARKRELYFLLKKGYSIISNISGEYKNGVSNFEVKIGNHIYNCLLYTSDAADDMQCVDLGGRRIIKKKQTA